MMASSTYLFIDGAYFQRRLQERADRVGIPRFPIDYHRLRNTLGCLKAFYYDCESTQNQQESRDDYDARLEAEARARLRIEAATGYHVFLGTMKPRRGKRPPHQKEVDIRIAVDMLTHAHRGNMTHAYLVAGDLDFKPLVDALVQDGVYVTLIYDRRSAAHDLLLAADERRELYLASIREWCMAEFQTTWQLPQVKTGPSDPEGLELVRVGCGLTDEGSVTVKHYISPVSNVLIHEHHDSYLHHSHTHLGWLEASLEPRVTRLEWQG